MIRLCALVKRFYMQPQNQTEILRCIHSSFDWKTQPERFLYGLWRCLSDAKKSYIFKFALFTRNISRLSCTSECRRVHQFLMKKNKLKESCRKRNRTQEATCLGCTGCLWSQRGTHSGRWHDGTGRCCARTADTSGCSGAHRTPESRLQPTERGRGEERESVTNVDGTRGI